MDLEEIKNLIEKDKGKFIIVEDGEAILVMMSFKDYEKIINGYKNNVFEQADSMIEKEKETEQKKEIEREKEIKELKQEIELEKEREMPEEQEQESLSEGLSEESKDFFDMPIQAQDEEAELEDLPVR